MSKQSERDARRLRIDNSYSVQRFDGRRWVASQYGDWGLTEFAARQRATDHARADLGTIYRAVDSRGHENMTYRAWLRAEMGPSRPYIALQLLADDGTWRTASTWTLRELEPGEFVAGGEV